MDLHWASEQDELPCPQAAAPVVSLKDRSGESDATTVAAVERADAIHKVGHPLFVKASKWACHNAVVNFSK